MTDAAVTAPRAIATGTTPGAAFAAIPATARSAARPTGAACHEGSRRPDSDSTARPTTTDAATSAASVA